MPNAAALKGMDQIRQMDLPRGAVDVFEQLAVLSGPYGCHPSTAVIAERINMCRRSVFANLKRLEVAGLIERVARFRLGRKIRRANEYRILFASEAAPPSAESAQQCSETLRTSQTHTDQDTRVAQAQPAPASPLIDSEPLPPEARDMKALLEYGLQKPVSVETVKAAFSECEGIHPITVLQQLRHIVRRGFHANGRKPVKYARYYLQSLANWAARLRESDPARYYPAAAWTPPIAFVPDWLEI